MAECSPLSGARRFGLRPPIDPIYPELNMQLGRVSSPDAPQNYLSLSLSIYIYIYIYVYIYIYMYLLACPANATGGQKRGGCMLILACSPYQLLNAMKPLLASVVFDPSNHERVKADSETLMHTTWRA